MRLDEILAPWLPAPPRTPPSNALIESGIASVDGITVRLPSWQVLPFEAVTFNGSTLPKRPLPKLIFHYKRTGVLSENKTWHRCPSVYDAIPLPLRFEHLGVWGRLDRDTTGLLLLGTDGGMQALFQNPRTKLPKVYRALIANGIGLRRGERPSAAYAFDYAAATRKFGEGVVLKEGARCAPAGLRWLRREGAEGGEGGHLGGRGGGRGALLLR